MRELVVSVFVGKYARVCFCDSVRACVQMSECVTVRICVRWCVPACLSLCVCLYVSL